MAYTQNPGRSPLLKTGNGIPAPFKQTRTGLTPKQNEEIEDVTKLNKFRNVVEAGAKLDSIAAAGARKLSGGNKFQQGLQGNLAANRARVAGGAGDMAVLRGRSSELYGSTAGGPNTPTYTRQNPIEKEHKRVKSGSKYDTGK
jgi:hypothetical protein